MAYFRCGGAGIPSSLKTGMNNVLNKKFGTVAQDYPPADWPDDVNLLGSLEEKTVSGAIASFSDGADDVPLKKFEVNIDPNLSGVSSVSVVHCGANIWDEQWEQGTYNTETGEPGYSSSRIRSKNDIFVKGVSSIYIVSPENIRCIFMDENKTVLGAPSAVHNGVVTPTTGAVYMRWYTGAGYGGTYNNDISFNLDTTDTAYHAYHSTTHTAQLGRTIYGGSVDVVNGTGTENEKQVKFSDLAWTYQSSYNRFRAQDLTAVIAKPATNQTVLAGLLSSAYTAGVANSSYATDQSIAVNVSGEIFVYDSNYTDKDVWLAQFGNDTISYPLETPETFTFTPVPINSLLGDNTLWADTGDINELIYRSAGTIQQYPNAEEATF